MLDGLDGTGLTGVGILPGPIIHPAASPAGCWTSSDYEGGALRRPAEAVGENGSRHWAATPERSMSDDLE